MLIYVFYDYSSYENKQVTIINQTMFIEVNFITRFICIFVLFLISSFMFMDRRFYDELYMNKFCYFIIKIYILLFYIYDFFIFSNKIYVYL
jgi:hypothetical protein